MATAADLAPAADLGVRVARERGTNAPFPLWLVNTDTAPNPAAEKILSPAERERADRFHADWLRNRYIAGHCALRLILEKCFGVPAARQCFSVNPFGKPRLVGMERAQFSMSYSGDRVLIGVASGMPVGVDIERLRPVKDARDLVPHLYTRAEQARLDQCEPNCHSFDRMFLEMWTRKEACVKAIGLGLGEVKISEIESGAHDGITAVRVGARQLRTDTTLINFDYIVSWAAGNVPVSSLITMHKEKAGLQSEGLRE